MCARLTTSVRTHTLTERVPSLGECYKNPIVICQEQFHPLIVLVDLGQHRETHRVVAKTVHSTIYA